MEKTTMFGNMGEWGQSMAKAAQKGMEQFVQMHKEGLESARSLVEGGIEQAERLAAPVEQAILEAAARHPEAEKLVKIPIDLAHKAHAMQRKAIAHSFEAYGRLLDHGARQMGEALGQTSELWIKAQENLENAAATATQKGKK
jgi:hypothetical protein